MQGFSQALQERHTKQWCKSAARPSMTGSGNLVNKRHAVATKTLQEKLKRRKKG